LVDNQTIHLDHNSQFRIKTMRDETGDEPDNAGANASDGEDDDREREGEGPGQSEKKKRKRKRKRSGKAKEEEHDDDDPHGDDAASSQKKKPAKASHEASNSSNSSEKDAVSRTVYVEGIPYEATEEQVRDFFRGLNVTSLRLPRWQDTGRLRGYGHAELATPKDYELALAKSGQSIPGFSRYLQIQPAKAPKPIGASLADVNHSDPSKTLILKNLSYEATEDDIQLVMDRFGPIAEGGIRIARHNSNRQSRGFAYVEFKQLESAVKAVKASASGGLIIRSRPCLVDYDHGTVQKSFRTETGRLWQKKYGKSTSDSK
jgi:nucleolin